MQPASNASCRVTGTPCGPVRQRSVRMRRAAAALDSGCRRLRAGWQDGVDVEHSNPTDTDQGFRIAAVMSFPRVPPTCAVHDGVGPRALVPVSTFVEGRGLLTSALSQSTDIAQHERQVRTMPGAAIKHLLRLQA